MVVVIEDSISEGLILQNTYLPTHGYCYKVEEGTKTKNLDKLIINN